MASTGFTKCGTGADASSLVSGDLAWNSASNITADDTSYADDYQGGFPSSTNAIRASNFGFSIPTDNVIDGIEIRVYQYFTEGFDTADYYLQLVNELGALEGNTKGGAVTSDAWTLDLEGGVSDVWGSGLTYADVNDTDFGCIYVATAGGEMWYQSGGLTDVVQIDYIEMNIHYSEPAAGNIVIPHVINM